MNDFTTLAWSNLSKQGHDQGLCHTWVKVTHIPKNRIEVQHSIYIIHNKTSLKKIFKFSDEIYLFQRICFIKIQMVCWARERD